MIKIREFLNKLKIMLQRNNNDKLLNSLKKESIFKPIKSIDVEINIYKSYNEKQFVSINELFKVARSGIIEMLNKVILYDDWIDFVEYYFWETKMEFGKDFICKLEDNYKINWNDLYVLVQYSPFILACFEMSERINKK